MASPATAAITKPPSEAVHEPNSKLKSMSVVTASATGPTVNTSNG